MQYSTFVHEVKNSLNVIYNCVSIIKAENNSDEKNKYLNIMLNAIDSVKDLDKDFESYRKTGEITIRDLTRFERKAISLYNCNKRVYIH